MVFFFFFFSVCLGWRRAALGLSSLLAHGFDLLEVFPARLPHAWLPYGAALSASRSLGCKPGERGRASQAGSCWGLEGGFHGLCGAFASGSCESAPTAVCPGVLWAGAGNISPAPDYLSAHRVPRELRGRGGNQQNPQEPLVAVSWSTPQLLCYFSPFP